MSDDHAGNAKRALEHRLGVAHAQRFLERQRVGARRDRHGRGGIRFARYAVEFLHEDSFTATLPGA